MLDQDQQQDTSVASPDPATATVVEPNLTQDGPGLKQIKNLFALGQPDPALVRSIYLQYQGTEGDAIIAFLQANAGNDYVNKVLGKKEPDLGNPGTPAA